MSEMKNIHAFEREYKIFVNAFKANPRDISDREMIAKIKKDPHATRKYTEEVSVTNAHSCAEYAAQFVNIVNSFSPHERPYLVIGVKCAIEAILKADVDSEMKYKFLELDDLCRKILTVGAFVNKQGAENAR